VALLLLFGAPWRKKKAATVLVKATERRQGVEYKIRVRSCPELTGPYRILISSYTGPFGTGLKSRRTMEMQFLPSYLNAYEWSVWRR